MKPLRTLVLALAASVGGRSEAHVRVQADTTDAWLLFSDEVLIVDGRSEGPLLRPLKLDGGKSHTVEHRSGQFEIPKRNMDPCSPIRFVVLGDGRAGRDGIGPSAYFEGLLTEVLARQPAFIVHTGDLVKDGHSRAEWSHYLDTLPPVPPIISVRGNHDRGRPFLELGLAEGAVFSVVMGPVTIVGVDTEVSTVDTILLRLEAKLASAQTPFLIVVHHRPIWSRGTHGSDERGWNKRLVPLYERYGVDVVLAGHDHNYERFCPLLGLGDERRCVESGQGPLYLVTGGAGTDTNPVPGLSRRSTSAQKTLDDRDSRVFSGTHHFVELEIYRGALHGTAFRTRTGNLRPAGVFDRFVITKPDVHCAGTQEEAAASGDLG